MKALTPKQRDDYRKYCAILRADTTLTWSQRVEHLIEYQKSEHGITGFGGLTVEAKVGKVLDPNMIAMTMFNVMEAEANANFE